MLLNLPNERDHTSKIDMFDFTKSFLCDNINTLYLNGC